MATTSELAPKIEDCASRLDGNRPGTLVTQDTDEDIAVEPPRLDPPHQRAAHFLRAVTSFESADLSRNEVRIQLAFAQF